MFLTISIGVKAMNYFNLSLKKLYDPKSFSATRFANYVIRVYDSFRHDYPIIVETLKCEKFKALDLNASKSDKEIMFSW